MQKKSLNSSCKCSQQYTLAQHSNCTQIWFARVDEVIEKTLRVLRAIRPFTCQFFFPKPSCPSERSMRQVPLYDRSICINSGCMAICKFWHDGLSFFVHGSVRLTSSGSQHNAPSLPTSFSKRVTLTSAQVNLFKELRGAFNTLKRYIETTRTARSTQIDSRVESAYSKTLRLSVTSDSASTSAASLEVEGLLDCQNDESRVWKRALSRSGPNMRPAMNSNYPRWSRLPSSASTITQYKKFPLIWQQK